jgi:hypothetical protein
MSQLMDFGLRAVVSQGPALILLSVLLINRLNRCKSTSGSLRYSWRRFGRNPF